MPGHIIATLIALAVGAAAPHDRLSQSSPPVGNTGFVTRKSAQDSLRIRPDATAAVDRRPLVAIVADAAGTELSDFMIPHAVLTESGVARVVTVVREPGRVRLWPGNTVAIDAELTMKAFDAANPQGADYVIVPALVDHSNTAVTGWLRAQAARGATIVSICEGARTLASAGLLDGRRATTHWSAIRELSARYPATKWVRDRRYVADDHLITTSGVSASLPASIYLVERIAGRVVADSIARTIGLRSWEPAHDSDAFRVTRWMYLKAMWNAVLPWRHEPVGVAVTDGVDEVALAFTVDAISRSIRGRAFTWSAGGGSVTSRQGLRITVERAGGFVTADTRQIQLTASPAHWATTLDSVIARLTSWYGSDTADLIAMGMEYPRVRSARR